MADAWDVLGFGSIAARIAESLEDGDVVVVEGQPGSGKSSLAKGIGLMWEEGEGSAVFAEGDVRRSDTSLFPFAFTTGVQSTWKLVLPLVSGMAKTGDTLLGTAGLLGSIASAVETAVKLRSTLQRGRAPSLPDEEQDVLLELERLSRGRPLLFIADNLHWWDAASLDLLRRLRDPRMWAAFPFLAELRVLAVQTPEPYQSVLNKEAYDALLQPSLSRSFRVERPGKDRFGEVLDALGSGGVPSHELTAAAYAISGGHLALAQRCSARIAKGQGDQLIAGVDSDDFVRRLMDEQIRALGPKARQALSLLQIAATLGLTFGREELQCARKDEDGHETSELLRYCRGEGVLELNDGVGHFVHELYRQHFLTVGSLDLATVHEVLGECLRGLRPGDYGSRCENAMKAEQTDTAATLGVHAALQRQRDGLPWIKLSPAIVYAIEQGKLTQVVERFDAALAHLNDYRYDACQEALAGLPHRLPSSLRAEAVYLRATCLIATRSGVNRAEAIRILEDCSELAENEPELYIRLLMLHLYALTLEPDKEPGRALERRIQGLLVARASFDPTAEDASYTLDRCAGSLYTPDVSLIRVREAAQHFAPGAGQTHARRPVEYYRCLVNYGSALIANACYDQACDVGEQIEALIHSYADDVFPRLDYPRTNTLLAQYRAGRLDAAGAVERQREIVRLHELGGDPFYVENALAVYLALTGEAQESDAIYERLLAELAGRREPEENMLYLLSANRYAARFVAGENVAEKWEALTGLVARNPYAIGYILVRRHELLGEVIRGGGTWAPLAFDECLLAGRPTEFGRLWDQLGRGFRLPEIEWWR